MRMSYSPLAVRALRRNTDNERVQPVLQVSVAEPFKYLTKIIYVLQTLARLGCV